MKFTITIICLSVLQAAATHMYSQSEKLSLDIKDMKVTDALKEIENKSGYFFLYSPSVIDLNRKVNLQGKDKPIMAYLSDLFEGTNTRFALIGRQIVVSSPPLMYAQQSTEVRNRSTLADALPGMSSDEFFDLITGTVKDATGDPLIGVNILVKGESIGTVSDIDGRYTIDVPSSEGTLVFSYTGYQTREVALEGNTTIDVTLQESISQLDEIVVVGFGTQKANKLISSVAQVGGEALAIEKRPVTSIQSALVGALPGLRGFNNNGRPGNNPNFSIRGRSSLNSTNILVIIDGFEGSLADIDPQTIENVSILKDASAVAIYGARGANGVMVVTTRNTNRDERLSVTYNFNHTFQKPSRIASTPNSLAFMQFRNEAFLNEGSNPEFDQAALDRAAQGFYPETVWPEELYTDNAGMQSHNVTVSGGSGKTGYLISGSFLSQNGLVIGADNFNRKNLRIKIDTDINDWLTIGTNALISNRVSKSTPAVGGNTLKGRPFFPVKTEDGFWVVKGGAGEANALGNASSGTNNKSTRDAVNGQLYAQIKPLPRLTIEERLSFVKNNTHLRSWKNIYDFVTLDESDPDSYTNPESSNREYTFGSPDQRRLDLSSSSGYKVRTLTTVNYELSNDQHSASMLLGFQSEQGESNSLKTGRTGFILDNVVDLGLGQKINENIGGGIGNSSSLGGNATTLSYFGRLNYDFLSKYLVEFTFRVDGSSNFLDNNRYGTFPAIALGWNLAEEDFFKKVRSLDQLKLRASYGSAGDDSGVGRRVVQLVNLDVTGYPIGGTIQPRINIGTPASKSLQWETSTTLNLGLDFSLWSGKFQGTVEYFVTQRDDILDEVITPKEFGFGNVPANLYAVKSWGWELDLTHRNKVGKLNYWLTGNISNYDI